MKFTARLIIPALALALVASSCGDDTADSASGGETKLSLVAYSVAKAAYDVVGPAFAATPEGKGVTFEASYGASGDQSRAVEKGLAADYVAFSLATDITRLVKAGLVADDWDQGPTKGIVTDSVVVLVVREGNPKGITGWDDIIKPGIQIVTPNPGSSGAARWNILGAYGQVLAGGGSDADAEAYLNSFYSNVVSQPASGREATSAFTAGTGDVLISYENEVILARQNGEKLDYVVPDNTFLIENPVAVLKDAKPQATAFLNFVLSPAAQKLFISKGFRSPVAGVEVGAVDGANDPSKPFPDVKTTTVADLGGWSEITRKFFDEDTGIVPKIQAAKGLGG